MDEGQGDELRQAYGVLTMLQAREDQGAAMLRNALARYHDATLDEAAEAVRHLLDRIGQYDHDDPSVMDRESRFLTQEGPRPYLAYLASMGAR